MPGSSYHRPMSGGHAQPGRTWPLVGRAAELDDLDDLLSRAADGAGSAVIVEGEAGIGKSSLVDALHSGARMLGIDAHFGPPSSWATARWGDADPTLVVIENVHSADLGALVALEAQARRGPGPRTLVVLTLRPVPRRAEVASVVTAWTRAGARHVEVRPLTADAAGELAESIVGGPLGPVLRGAVATAGGSPRFVVDIVQTARDSGALALVDGAVEVVDQQWLVELDGLVQSRVRYLGDDVVALLTRATVLGSSFVVVDLAALDGEQVGDVWHTLRHALAAGVVQARGDRLVFRHDVVRTALYASMPAERRRMLHAQAAWTLREAGAPESVVARHLDRAR